MPRIARFGAVVLAVSPSVVAAQYDAATIRQQEQLVETACGDRGDEAVCKMVRQSLEMMRETNSGVARDDGSASLSSGNDQLPLEYQTSDADTLAVMNRQKAEMCSPPPSGDENTCRMMEEGRQMLLAKMRGGDTTDGANHDRVADDPGAQRNGCVAGRVENGSSTSPSIVLANGCGKGIFFNLCVNKQGDAAVSRLPGRTAADRESRYDMWTPKHEKFTWAFQWSYTDPAPVASC